MHQGLTNRLTNAVRKQGSLCRTPKAIRKRSLNCRHIICAASATRCNSRIISNPVIRETNQTNIRHAISFQVFKGRLRPFSCKVPSSATALHEIERAAASYTCMERRTKIVRRCRSFGLAGQGRARLQNRRYPTLQLPLDVRY